MDMHFGTLTLTRTKTMAHDRTIGSSDFGRQFRILVRESYAVLHAFPTRPGHPGSLVPEA